MASVHEIADFGELPVFEDAAAEPAIVLATKEQAAAGGRFAQIPNLDFDDLGTEIDRLAFPVLPSAITGAEWRLVPHEVAALLGKMEAAGTPLGKVVGGRICWGVKTGLNEAFIDGIDSSMRDRLIAEDPRSAEVIQPLVVGDDVRRYHIDRRDAWLLYLPHDVDIARYPAVERYLAPFRNALEKRATRQAWYELQQPQAAYREFFEGPKILYPEMAMDPRFAFDAGPLYPNNKCFLIPGENWFLLGLLNSRLAFFYLSQICSVLGDAAQGGRLELRAQYMQRLPIPHASHADTAELADLARRMTELEAATRRERGEFLTWLEEEIGSPVDALANQTRVRGYDRHDADALLAVLERNHPRRVRIDVAAPRAYGARNAARERIADAHATSTGRLAPLAAEFADLDARADRLVYRLYGLSADEVATVDDG